MGTSAKQRFIFVNAQRSARFSVTLYEIERCSAQADIRQNEPPILGTPDALNYRKLVKTARLTIQKNSAFDCIPFRFSGHCVIPRLSVPQLKKATPL